VPRKPRPTAAGFYHVAARASVGEHLFRDDHDFLRFLTELEHAAEKESCLCVAVCMMTTHYHLLLETAENALPRVMQRLNTRYAKAYNARYGRRGHAFAHRYLSVPITDTEQLLAVFRYIARNPVEAGLCEHAHEWPWSSYAASVGLAGGYGFVDASIVTGACGGSPEDVRALVSDTAQRCLTPLF
jgi:putative transposase